MHFQLSRNEWLVEKDQVLQFELDLARADSMKFRSALELEKIQQQLEQYRYSIHE